MRSVIITMVKLLIFTFFVLQVHAATRGPGVATRGPGPTTYKISYRDHIFHTLSEKGKEMFYALNIHPSCVEKAGECIPRSKCIEKKYLYISRVCYKRDLVCCYDGTIRNIVVGTDRYTSTTTEASSPQIKRIS